MDKKDTYRGWSISYAPKPIPTPDLDWEATHEDYDADWQGEETGWVGNGLHVVAASRDELIDRIDEAQDEWEEENGHFGVGS